MPKFIQWLFPERIWAFSGDKNSIYLTFDDGPIPEITPWVLDVLKKHKAEATFFCIGENIQKNPEVFQRIISEGHSVGNHTFNHLNGWKTKTSEYLKNVEKAERQMIEEIQINTPTDSAIPNHQLSRVNEQSIFRPPYGKITSKQSKILQKKGFKVVMWGLISYDFDASVSEEKCLQNVLNHTKPGSVIVFHDSLKAENNLRYVLPKVLEYASNKGWRCVSIYNSNSFKYTP